MDNSSFVFYGTWQEQLNELPDDMRLKFYGYICNYGLYDTEPEVRGIEKALWIPIKYAIDTAKERRNQNKVNGAKGGRPAKNTNTDKAEESNTKEEVTEDATDSKPVNEEEYSQSKESRTADTKPLITENKPVKTQNNPQKPTSNLNGNVNGNGNVNDNVNANGNFNVGVKSCSSDTHIQDSKQRKTEQSTTTTDLLFQKTQNKLHSLCFDFDTNAVHKISAALTTSFMNPEGETGYLDYCLSMLCQKKFHDGKRYTEKPKPEQQTLFLTAVTSWTDWQSGYSDWKKQEEELSRKKFINHVRSKPPVTCPKCGKPLQSKSGEPICFDCGISFSFDQVSGKWIEYERPSISIAAGLQHKEPVLQQEEFDIF